MNPPTPLSQPNPRNTNTVTFRPIIIYLTHPPNHQHALRNITSMLSPQSPACSLPNHQHALSPVTSMLSPQSPACSLPHHQHALSLITSMLSPPSPAGNFPAGAGQLDPAPVRKFLGNFSTGVQQKSKPATTTRPKPGFPV